MIFIVRDDQLFLSKWDRLPISTTTAVKIQLKIMRESKIRARSINTFKFYQYINASRRGILRTIQVTGILLVFIATVSIVNYSVLHADAGANPLSRFTDSHTRPWSELGIELATILLAVGFVLLVEDGWLAKQIDKLFKYKNNQNHRQYSSAPPRPCELCVTSTVFL